SPAIKPPHTIPKRLPQHQDQDQDQTRAIKDGSKTSSCPRIRSSLRIYAPRSASPVHATGGGGSSLSQLGTSVCGGSDAEDAGRADEDVKSSFEPQPSPQTSNAMPPSRGPAVEDVESEPEPGTSAIGNADAASDGVFVSTSLGDGVLVSKALDDLLTSGSSPWEDGGEESARRSLRRRRLVDAARASLAIVRSFAAATDASQPGGCDAIVRWRPRGEGERRDDDDDFGTFFGGAWILAGAKVRPCAGRGAAPAGPDGEEAVLLRRVGRILRDVFSRWSSAPPSSPALSEGDAMPDVGGRNRGFDGWKDRIKPPKINKGRDADDVRVLTGDSTLRSSSSTKRLPLAVRRMLADLLDEHSEHPIGSMEDVARELEWMIHRPNAFLYDPGVEFGASRSRFGRGHFGRREEVATLLGISRKVAATAATVEAAEATIEGTTATTAKSAAAAAKTATAMGPAAASASASVRAATMGERVGSGTWVERRQELASPAASTATATTSVSAVEGKTAASITLEISAEASSSEDGEHAAKTGRGVDVAFVRGVAGSGKSRLVRHLADRLRGEGSRASAATFRRGRERESLAVLTDLGEEKGVVSNALADALDPGLDPTQLAFLALFVPSVRALIWGSSGGGGDGDERPSPPQSLGKAEAASCRRLAFPLTRLLGAILGASSRNVLVFLDDLHVLAEVLFSNNARLVVVGAYRDDEVTESHPLARQLGVLRGSANAKVTEIRLSSLATDDVADMIALELRLPRRLISGLADVVHKTTCVQLLGSLAEDSTIAYSPRKRRFDWDE
ncbi:hypothetical protein ACHAWF_009284, partial [Thalassiosira exigua]